MGRTATSSGGGISPLTTLFIVSAGIASFATFGVGAGGIAVLSSAVTAVTGLNTVFDIVAKKYTNQSLKEKVQTDRRFSEMKETSLVLGCSAAAALGYGFLSSPVCSNGFWLPCFSAKGAVLSFCALSAFSGARLVTRWIRA